MNDEYEKGYKEAQTEIAKRLLETKYKIPYVANWTGLPNEEVIVIQHKDDIEQMIKEGYSTDTIAFVLNLPFGDVASAVVLLNHTPFISGSLFKRITFVYPTGDFKLIMKFNSEENRALDMKEFLKDEKGLLAEIRDNLELFLNVKLDNVAGTIYWSNGVDFDPEVLYKNSQEIL